MNQRSNALADRLEYGARALADCASELTTGEWETPVRPDGRKIGVIVHHVATMYGLEIQLAQQIAAGNAVEGVTAEVVNDVNELHASENDDVTKQETLDLLLRNSSAAAAAVRALSDDQLDNSARVSLYSDAPLTCQFFLEDHAVRHSYHHLAGIERTLTQSRESSLEEVGAGR